MKTKICPDGFAGDKYDRKVETLSGVHGMVLQLADEINQSTNHSETTDGKKHNDGDAAATEHDQNVSRLRWFASEDDESQTRENVEDKSTKELSLHLGKSHAAELEESAWKSTYTYWLNCSEKIMTPSFT